jgi:triacylglycerol esterase/lipase EstA (alpha/beta hydrolase family)
MAVLLLSSCSIRVKVREEWNDLYRKPIQLNEAARVWETIREGGTPDDAGLAAYNDAVRSSVVQIGDNWASHKDRLSGLRTSEGEVNLRVNPVNVQNVEFIEEIIPADFLKVRRGFRSEAVVNGVGASLLVKQPRLEADPMIPSSGLWYPVTAVLNLDEPTAPVLELIDPTKQRAMASRGGDWDFPLAANYTAAFARDFQDRQFEFETLAGLLSFEKFADRIGLYRVTAFDPAKQPCLFVHGINSSPSTWDETINRLYGVEEIRERYEFWSFGYPTGAPIPYMASRLRESILRMIAFRQANGAPDLPITIVGHSMGGLLSKAVTQSSGDAEWNQLFKVPLSELKVSDTDRETLRAMIYFEPIPQVKRVVFCATPHRGSKLAENPAAKLVVDLIEVPSQLLQLSAEIISQSAHALTPLGLEFARDRMTSIEQLSSNARTTSEFLNKPLNPAVTYYSIIGNNSGPNVPLEKSSDNIVAYTSAHLEGVASEVVIRKSAHSVHQSNGGIEEIIRILKLP